MAIKKVVWTEYLFIVAADFHLQVSFAYDKDLEFHFMAK